MSLLSKTTLVSSAIWLRNIHNKMVNKIVPSTKSAVNIDSSHSLGSEPQASTSTSVFTVENEMRAGRPQKQISSIVEDAFGDVKSFIHLVQSDRVNNPLSVVSDGNEIIMNNSNGEESVSEETLQQQSLEIQEAIEPVVESEVVQVAESEVEQVAESEVEQVAESEVEQVAEPVVDQVEESGVEQVAESEAEQVIEHAPSCDVSDNTLIQEFLASKGIGVQDSEKNFKPSAYVSKHFDLMFILGTSTYNTRDPNAPNPWSTWGSSFQMLFFLFIVSLSILQAFFDAKYCFVLFLYGGGLNQLVRVAFNLICLVSSAYGAYIMCHKGIALRKMFSEMCFYERTWVGHTKYHSFPFALAITTTFLAFLRSIIVLQFDEFSLSAVVLEGSYVISEDLFLWLPTNISIYTEQLDAEYASNLNSISISMGAFKVIRDFAFNLQQGLVWDIFANIILAMLSWILSFMVFVNAVKDNIPDDDTDEEKKLQRLRVVVWKMYREIRDTFAAVNDVFSPLLMLFHITNLLRYAFLMERCIFPENATAFVYIHLLFDIVKSEVIYLTATNISHQNKVIRKWLRSWAAETGNIDLGNKKLDITVVLDELDEEPLGLGQGEYVIDQGFHFGLLGLVSSLFVILANKTGAKV